MQVSCSKSLGSITVDGELTEDYFKICAAYMATVAQRSAFRNMWKIDRTKILQDRFCEYMDTALTNEAN
jgi:hypothetical protein